MGPETLTLMTNPFAALTAIVGPAVLTNACSVLTLGTSNRLARVVDQTRVVFKEMAALEPGDERRSEHADQLATLDIRAGMLLRSLRAFYAALGLFATAALLSAIGSVVASYERDLGFRVLALGALLTGGSAVVGLVIGCVAMVRETRLAVRTLEREARLRVRPSTGDASP